MSHRKDRNFPEWGLPGEDAPCIDVVLIRKEWLRTDSFAFRPLQLHKPVAAGLAAISTLLTPPVPAELVAKKLTPVISSKVVAIKRTKIFNDEQRKICCKI